jgi:hypothetical protein
MPLSTIQFDKVRTTLLPALEQIQRAHSGSMDEQTEFHVTTAHEALNAPGRDSGKTAAEIVSPRALASLTRLHDARVGSISGWFGAVDSVWRELEDIRTAYVYNRGEFDTAIVTLNPDELDALASVFARFGETLSPSQLNAGSGDVYKRLMRNQGNERFPEIAARLRLLADQQRARDTN